MADLMPEQQRVVQRLVAHGFSEERALEIATETQPDGSVEDTFSLALAGVPE